MRTTLWVRAATLAVAGLGALVTSGTAWAATNAVLRSGQAPTTAAAFSAHQCDANFGGGPYADQDVWTFVLPSHSRDFLSLTASFDTTGDGTADVTVSTASAGGIRDDNGSSKAWIPAPAGAKLLSASAVVTGAETDGPSSFNISRTCPAVAAAPSPSPAVSVGAGGSVASASPSPAFPPIAVPAGMPGREDRRSLTGASPVGDFAVSPEAVAPPDEEVGVEPSTAVAARGGKRHETSVALSTSVLLALVAGVGVLLMAVWRRRGRKRPAVIGRHRLAPDETE